MLPQGDDETARDSADFDGGQTRTFLALRLARANTLRRKQFGYWRKRHSKLVANTAGEDGETQAKVNILQEDSGLQEQTATSQPGQPPSLATSVTKVEDSKVDLRDSQSTFSNVTYSLAKQESDREKVPIPELPGSFLEPKEFECPFCFELCPRKMGRGPDWE